MAQPTLRGVTELNVFAENVSYEKNNERNMFRTLLRKVLQTYETSRTGSVVINCYKYNLSLI